MALDNLVVEHTITTWREFYFVGLIIPSLTHVSTKLSMWGYLVDYLYEHMFSLISETIDFLYLLEICQQYNQLLYMFNDLLKLENNLNTWKSTKTYINQSSNLSLTFDLLDAYHEEIILLKYLGLLEA